MTEAEWLAGDDPWPMLQSQWKTMGRRQLVLFVVACCRRFGKFPDARDNQLLAQAEEFADGVLSPEQFKEMLAAAAHPVPRGRVAAGEWWALTREQQRRGKGAVASAELLRVVAKCPPLPATEEIKPAWQRRLAKALHEVQNQAARGVEGSGRTFGSFGDTQQLERSSQAATLRHVLGNPFRPRTPSPDWLAWNGGAVPKLAQALYEGRDWGQLPILGDALEEAGCTDQELLRHCRQPGEHMRGCWVLDFLRGGG